VEARRWQLLALVADGKTVKDATALVGLNVYYARRVVRRYNREGPTSLRDRRLGSTSPRSGGMTICAASGMSPTTQIQAAHPGAEVQLWATDEHRIGLLPLIGRVWAPVGKRPIAPVQQLCHHAP